MSQEVRAEDFLEEDEEMHDGADEDSSVDGDYGGSDDDSGMDRYDEDGVGDDCDHDSAHDDSDEDDDNEDSSEEFNADEKAARNSAFAHAERHENSLSQEQVRQPAAHLARDFRTDLHRALLSMPVIDRVAHSDEITLENLASDSCISIKGIDSVSLPLCSKLAGEQKRAVHFCTNVYTCNRLCLLVCSRRIYCLAKRFFVYLNICFKIVAFVFFLL
jgi:hypothetical protein